MNYTEWFIVSSALAVINGLTYYFFGVGSPAGNWCWLMSICFYALSFMFLGNIMGVWNE